MAVDGAGRPVRRWRIALLAALVAVGIGVSPAFPAGAVPPPPPNPSDQQIQASQDHVAANAAEVGKLSGLVSTTQAQIQQLQDAMELKAELAMKAQVDLQTAQSEAADADQAAHDAQQSADRAGSAIVTAQQGAAAFAAASFRQGSVLGSMTALLDADSMDQLLARKQMIDQVSDTQLDVLTTLETARTTKANLDSKAKAALQAAKDAESRAQQAQTAAIAAKVAAEQSFNQGQARLADLNKQLTDQQAQYQAALNTVADLKGQRDQYNSWVQAQQAEQQRLDQQAAVQAQQARQALRERQAAQQQLLTAQAVKAAAVGKEKDKQAAILAAMIRLEQQRQAAIKRAQELAARNAAAKEAQQSSNGGGSSSGSSAPSSPPASNLSRGQQVVQAALAWLGTPYAWGGGTANGPSRGIHDYGTADYYGDYNKIGFDCSGLALYAWAQVGVYLPHYSAYQYFSGKHVAASALQPGDLVFYAYNTSDPSTIHHVAIYMGNNKMIEAPQSGSYVKISTMRWSGYIGATRPGT